MRNGSVKGMLWTSWRRSYCGQTSLSQWTGPLSSDHSLRPYLLQWRSCVKGSSPASHECSRKSGSRCLDLISNDVLTGIPSDSPKKFTLLRILLGLVKAALFSIRQTVRASFGPNRRVTDILAYQLRQKCEIPRIFNLLILFKAKSWDLKYRWKW